MKILKYLIKAQRHLPTLGYLSVQTLLNWQEQKNKIKLTSGSIISYIGATQCSNSSNIWVALQVIWGLSALVKSTWLSDIKWARRIVCSIRCPFNRPQEAAPRLERHEIDTYTHCGVQFNRILGSLIAYLWKMVTKRPQAAFSNTGTHLQSPDDNRDFLDISYLHSRHKYLCARTILEFCSRYHYRKYPVFIHILRFTFLYKNTQVPSTNAPNCIKLLYLSYVLLRWQVHSSNILMFS